jgi:hypothetical protein
VSSGLQGNWVRRVLAGVRYENRDFSALQGYESSDLPQDRVLAYPWIGFEWIEDDYIKTWNFDQIGRTEDLHLGRAARLEAGFASGALGASRMST